MPYKAPFKPGPSERITFLENDGNWEVGGTYTVKWYRHTWNLGSGSIDGIFRYAVAPLYLFNQGSTSWNDVTGNVFTDTDSSDDYFINPDLTFTGNTGFDFVNYTDPNLINIELVSSISTDFTDLGGVSGDDNYTKYLVTAQITVPLDAAIGIYSLLYYGAEIDTVGDIGTTAQRVDYPINIIGVGGTPPSTFPEERVASYDPDAVWDPDGGGGGGGYTNTLSDLTTLGGGRYNQQLVVLNNKGNIYFGALT